MRFVVDAQLPPALARWLASKGHEAEHVNDCGMGAAADRTIWEYAERCGAVILTKDEDFAQRKVMRADGPQIVWIRSPNTRRRELLLWIEKILPLILVALARGEPLIEVF